MKIEVRFENEEQNTAKTALDQEIAAVKNMLYARIHSHEKFIDDTTACLAKYEDELMKLRAKEAEVIAAIAARKQQCAERVSQKNAAIALLESM